MTHGAELARFIGDGETRQLYALDRRSGRLVYMPEGEADRFRADCHAGHLVCPIETCQDRTFIAYGGTQKRHHFKHKVVVAAHESYYHQLGKRLLGEHLHARYPEARVVVDHEAVDNGQRPDILIEFPDGRRFAIELQYSHLPLEVWKARHDGYRRQGLIDIWVLGHRPPQLRASRTYSEQQSAWSVDLHPLAQTIRKTGAPVVFFNPDERMLAVATAESGDEFVLSWDRAELAYDVLDSVELRARRLWTPTIAIEHRARITRRRETIEERKRERAAAVAAAEREARRRERERQEAAYIAKLSAEREARLVRWRSAQPEFLRRTGIEAVPPIIAQERKTDWWTLWHPAHWHARLFYEFIENRLGETFSYDTAKRRLFRAQKHGQRRAYVGLRAYLFELRRRGYLHFASEGYTIYNPILVIADLKHPPTPALARGAVHGLVAIDGDDVVLVTRGGHVLRHLRARRAGDSFVDVAVLREQERERRQRAAAQLQREEKERQTRLRTEQERRRERQPRERPPDPLPRFLAPGVDLHARREDDRVLVEIRSSRFYNPGFRTELEQRLRDRLGETEIVFEVYPSFMIAEPTREVWPQRVSPDDATLAAITAIGSGQALVV